MDMFKVQGAAGLMKDGGRVFGGTDAKLKNIEANKQLCSALKTSMGPRSRQKLIVNHIDKVFVTSDASTIVEQMEVQHPAVKSVIKAAQCQATEFGDQTSFLMCFAGELLERAGTLMQQGVHVVDIIKGYELCEEHVESIIEGMSVWELTEDDMRKEENLSQIAYSAISSKGGDHSAFIAEKVGHAANLVCKSSPASFKAQNVRVLKVPGASTYDSDVIHGLVVARALTSIVNKIENSEEEPLKVIVLNCDLAHNSTDTTGNVLITDTSKMASFGKEEDERMNQWVKDIKDKGIKAVIVGGHISDTAQNFCDDHGLLTFRVISKYELKRLCQAVRAPAMTKLVVPPADDIGIAKRIEQIEIGSTQCTVFEAIDSTISTVVLRGSSQAVMDELERAIDDGIGVIEAAATDRKFLVGAGASDMALSLDVAEFASKLKGLEQYSAQGYADCLRLVPCVLIESAGLPRTLTLTALAKAHQNGKSTTGINMDKQCVAGCYTEGQEMKSNHLCHLKSKKWAIKFATDAACTILNVDEIIMSKPAGGPKFPNQGHWDAQDEKKPLDSGY